MIPLKKLKIKINNPGKLEALLQEIYSEACKDVEQIQNEMNKLSNSINLNDEIVDSKAKYAKAMNDFISSKDKAIGRKIDVAKLLSEIIKYNGNTNKVLTESDVPGDWDEFINKANEFSKNSDSTETNDGAVEYTA